MMTERKVKRNKGEKPLQVVKKEDLSATTIDCDLTETDINAVSLTADAITIVYKEAKDGIDKMEGELAMFVTKAFLLKYKGVLAERADEIAAIQLAIESKTYESAKN